MASWMQSNLATQGYCLSDAEARDLRIGLRFSTGLCLAMTAGALALGSAVAFAGLAVIGAIAGWTARHPFDHLWNHGLRHLLGHPALPPNPPRRRHAFKVATAMMLVLALLFAAGATTAGYVFGGMVLAACAAVTVLNLCIPSLVLERLERDAKAHAATP